MPHSLCQQIWKTQQWPQDWKRSVFIPFPKKGNAKNVEKLLYAPSSHASRVMLKTFKLGFSSTWTKNFQMYKLDLEKAEEPEIKFPTSAGSLKKQESSRKKHLFLLYWLHQCLQLCGSQQTVENSWRYGNTRPPYLPPEKFVCRSRSNS